MSDDRAADRAAGLDRLDQLRGSIEECDRELIAVLRRRLELVREVGEVKAGLGIPVTDPKREAAVVRKAAERARRAGLDEELIRSLIWQVMSSARARQHGAGADPPKPAPDDRPRP